MTEAKVQTENHERYSKCCRQMKIHFLSRRSDLHRVKIYIVHSKYSSQWASLFSLLIYNRFHGIKKKENSSFSTPPFKQST